jgi:AcrR family transcriptional regulator
MRSARDAIVAAALARFASDGFSTPLRTIAADADVSAALILHHFGSKAGLRAAVDDYVLGIADEKMRLNAEGGFAAATAFVASVMLEGHVSGYLARTLAEDGDAGTRLFGSFVDVTEKAMLDLGIADPRMTAAIVVTHSMGMMTMAAHVEAATGDHPYSAEGIVRFGRAAVEIYRGALSPFIPPEVFPS